MIREYRKILRLWESQPESIEKMVRVWEIKNTLLRLMRKKIKNEIRKERATK